MASQHDFNRYQNMKVTVQDMVADTLTVAGTDVTAAILEVSAIDGLTASAAELNLNDGAVAGTSVASKTLALGANKNTDVLVVADGGFALGAGAGTAVTATAAELNLIDGSVAGTSVASKALSLGADKNTDVLALPVSGLKIGAGAGTAVDRTAAELNLISTGVEAGYKVARVTQALDGSNPTPWATGLTSVVAAIACLTGSGAPGTSTSCLSTEISGTTVNIHAWKPTSTIDTTLVASTGTEVVSVVAIGT